ncbi:hypothetical protein HYFRA_00011529 [Hymenoscyphus fraxineus]|uniref:Major facilitator superfamily (MFS) profile domain-containing protein n=1 Tax=Hymenoscyphus fraxineus TaxID=746836 RepID=A0A9N9PYH5_9HELO|nr:hypothetical protein HYFRA_00011529 [Hymenoscyphus fraxineus]
MSTPPSPNVPNRHSGENMANNSYDEEQAEINIVDWNGPDDPENPLNWSSTKKNVHVITISLFVLIANLAATMFAPGAQQLADEFHITDSTVEAMTVSLYVLGFGFGPLVLAPLSELYGRLIVYHFCISIYLAFTIGCAFSTNVAMFLVFRFMAGSAASGPLSIGGGTVADVTHPEQRGKAMGIFMIGPFLGPVLGPVIGGFVSQYCGWRWTFRILIILTGVIGAAIAIFTRETNASVLLMRKAERMRKETGNLKFMPRSTRQETPRQILFRAIARPMKLLIFSPIVFLISLYTGVMFGLMFLLFATFPSVFGETYGFSEGISGLAYIGLGLGMMLGLVLFSILSDKLLGQKQGGSVAKPEQRLILMKWFGPIAPLGCFMYGWSAYYHTHWIVPILGTFIIGLGALFVVIPGQIYLVDAFGAQAAASALAANLFIRSPFGAFMDLAAAPLYDKLGLGWGNSVLGFIIFAFTPVPWLFYRYGEFLRTRFVVEL